MEYVITLGIVAVLIFIIALVVVMFLCGCALCSTGNFLD